MPSYLIAGNWKMNLRRDSGRELAAALANVDVGKDVTIAICPPAPYLGELCDACRGTSLAVGAQDLHPAGDGAYTGEWNAEMLKDIGCQYVIVGHSERRAIFGEDDELINQKVQAALASGLRPILCVGETLDQREAEETENVVAAQLEGSLADITAEQMRNVVIAYEPVWAIGTGKTATPEQAEAVHSYIRDWLKRRFGDMSADVIIQYGGSVKADNAAELLGKPNINGALVGGASLKADSFLAICRAAGT